MVDVTVCSFFSPGFPTTDRDVVMLELAAAPHFTPTEAFIPFPHFSALVFAEGCPIWGLLCSLSKVSLLITESCLTFWSVLLGNNCEWSLTPLLNLFTSYWYLLQTWNCFAFIFKFFLRSENNFFKVTF